MRHPPLYWHYSLEKREEELLPAQLDSTTTMRLGAYFFTYSVSHLKVSTHTFQTSRERELAGAGMLAAVLVGTS